MNIKMGGNAEAEGTAEEIHAFLLAMVEVAAKSNMPNDIKYKCTVSIESQNLSETYIVAKCQEIKLEKLKLFIASNNDFKHINIDKRLYAKLCKAVFEKSETASFKNLCKQIKLTDVKLRLLTGHIYHNKLY